MHFQYHLHGTGVLRGIIVESIEKSDESRRICSAHRCFPVDDSAAAHAGQIRAELARLVMPIGPYDQLIAGHARSQGLALVTNNEKEFARVPGLRRRIGFCN